jgi:hypothetical protein
MKVNGTITTVRDEVVEIDRKELLKTLLRKYSKEFVSDLDLENDYIDSHNIVQKYDGDNHHNGNPEYLTVREASKADFDAFKFKRALVRILG